jgi:hypothetical protein
MRTKGATTSEVQQNDGCPTLRKKREGPRISYCAAPAMAACAAFYKESRMKFVDPHQALQEIRGAGAPLNWLQYPRRNIKSCFGLI